MARLHDAERTGREHGALVVEAAHQHADALADRAQHVLLRHFAILEDELAGRRAAHAQLVELLRRPGSPCSRFSTMKAVMPRGPAAGSVLA